MVQKTNGPSDGVSRRSADRAASVSPQNMLELYQTNWQAGLDILNAILEGASRMQQLQFDRDEQVRSLTSKVLQASTAGGPNGSATAHVELVQEALEQSAQYWQQVVVLGNETQRNMYQVIERHYGASGMLSSKPYLAALAGVVQLKDGSMAINP